MKPLRRTGVVSALVVGAAVGGSMGAFGGCSPSSDTSNRSTIGNSQGGGGGTASGGTSASMGGSGAGFHIDVPDGAPPTTGCSPTCDADGGPACGNGILDPDERCDDGNIASGDGCVATCDAVEQGYACPSPGDACVSTVSCGDGQLGGDETCDDGNTTASDGCDASCKLEAGWRCPVLGARCEAAECGDAIVAGTETCDDGNITASDGCDGGCQRETGWACPAAGTPCHQTVCGDGNVEGDEQCDDANNDLGDGCTPFCVNEPDCSGDYCVSRCGDGLRLPGDQEACEDGNTQGGDGCSTSCTVEPGWVCEDVTTTPTELVLPIVLRDLNKSHPDFEGPTGDDRGILATQLGPNGKPVYAPGASGTTPTTSGQANFDQWYYDAPGTNMTVVQTLTLTQLPSGEYQYSNTSFFPLDNLGFNEISGGVLGFGGHNFHFTSLVRYYFEYRGGEKLDFTGDDDVWVFVNKRLAVDLGGVHGAENGSVTLDAATAANLSLTVGRVYEIVVLQAERHTTESNYTLTLSGFTNTPTTCHSVCGDGIVTADEQCDDGKNDGSYGSCTPDCKRGPFCGDGVVQADAGEACDNAVNLDVYDVPDGCGPGCQRGGYCGDGKVDSRFGEQCDDGENLGGYGQCASDCRLGPRCGDGVVQADQGEACDDANTSNDDACTTSCQLSQLR